LAKMIPNFMAGAYESRGAAYSRAKLCR